MIFLAITAAALSSSVTAQAQTAPSWTSMSPQEREAEAERLGREDPEHSPEAMKEHVNKLLSKYEFDISGIKINMAKMRELIAQQRRAATISGYVDKSVMYSAGLMITRDQDMITQKYAEYRKMGGKKLLVAIHR